jgi:hypothetical protein
MLIDELQNQGQDFGLVRDGLNAVYSSSNIGALAFFPATLGLLLVTIGYAIYRQLVIRREAK